MKHLLTYFKGYLKETILGPIFKLLEASFELFVPMVIAYIMDNVIPKDDKNHLVMMIFLLFALAIIGCLAALTAQYYSAKTAVGYTEKMTADLFRKIMSLPQAERDKIGTSSLVSRVTSDTFQVQLGINMFLRLFLRSPFVVFGAIVMAYRISPRLTTWLILMVLILFAIVTLMSHLLNPYYIKIREHLDRLVGLTREQLQGVRVIRAFNQVEREKAEFQLGNAAYANQQLRAGYLSALVTPLTYLVVNLTLVIVLWHGGGAVNQGILSQGMLVALVNYLLQILTELIKLTMLVTTLNQSFVSANRIASVFALKSEDLKATLPEISNTDKAFQAKQVSFTYPKAAEPALTDVTVSLKPGQFLGIVGGTGSGKTSFVKLINRLYQPQEGSLAIFQNGKSPQTLKEWRDWVAVVPQQAELFKGSVRSNLTLGLARTVSDEELWQALEWAQAKDFILEKEAQLEASVEAFGRNFSGGQRQRLTIARALLQQKPILVLDDATSALDMITERRLLTVLREVFSQTTLVLVSQRLSSVQAADSILLLDKGHQVGLGSHEELLATNTIYQDIYRSQQKGGDASAETINP